MLSSDGILAAFFRILLYILTFKKNEKASCYCINGFSGENCENSPCDPNPCQNFGNCREITQSLGKRSILKQLIF